VIRANVLNLTSQTELFVNLKRVQKKKKGLYRIRVEFRAEPYLIESSQVEASLTRLFSNPNNKFSFNRSLFFLF